MAHYEFSDEARDRRTTPAAGAMLPAARRGSKESVRINRQCDATGDELRCHPKCVLCLSRLQVEALLQLFPIVTGGLLFATCFSPVPSSISMFLNSFLSSNKPAAHAHCQLTTLVDFGANAQQAVGRPAGCFRIRGVQREQQR